MRFLKGVVVSELFALWVEFFYKFGVKYFPKGFLMAIPLYFLYLCALHGIFHRLKERQYFWILGIAIGGIGGLLLEWFLVGNSPWNKPEVFQAGQLVFHGAYPILGYQLTHTMAPRSLWNRVFAYMTIISALTAIGFFFDDPNLRKLWVLFLPLVAFVGLYSFIYQLRSVHQSRDSISVT